MPTRTMACRGMPVPWHPIASHSKCMPCQCMPWHAVACHGMPMPWHPMASHGMPCQIMPWHAIGVPWHAMACHGCHGMPRHAKPCQAMLSHAMACHGTGSIEWIDRSDRHDSPGGLRMGKSHRDSPRGFSMGIPHGPHRDSHHGESSWGILMGPMGPMGSPHGEPHEKSP